ncbi:MAG: hypothetical protein ACC742_14585, partial [Thermoanaerobaculales bacterium]
MNQTTAELPPLETVESSQPPMAAIIDGNQARTSRTRRPDPPPPSGSLPLGLSLGIILAVVMAVVLGGLKALELQREIRHERVAREGLLEQSLAPLAADIEVAGSIAEIRERLFSFQRAYRDYGHPDHQLLVRDASGAIVASVAPSVASSPPKGALQAEIKVQTPLVDGGYGALVGWKDSTAFNSELRDRWHRWWFDLLVMSLVLIAAVEVAVYFLVGRPLGRLVRGIKRLERGYTARWDCGPAVWEIRWLAWRLHSYATELADSVLRLLRAERRGLVSTNSVGDPRFSGSTDPMTVVARNTMPRSEPGSPDPDSWRPEEICRLLNTLRPDDPLAPEVAAEAWTTAATEAERLQDMTLKADLEDGALRLVEPETFIHLEKGVAQLRRSRRGWVGKVAAQLAETLEKDGVPFEIIQHRVKHVAGAWRKMRNHEIDLDQVNDLFAFRIVVPSEEDCYLALAAIHRAFEPNPLRFKDYIAEPKANGYRSLHTSLRDAESRLFEVQIRSATMHHEAENGQAAHWQ